MSLMWRTLQKCSKDNMHSFTIKYRNTSQVHFTDKKFANISKIRYSMRRNCKITKNMVFSCRFHIVDVLWLCSISDQVMDKYKENKFFTRTKIFPTLLLCYPYLYCWKEFITIYWNVYGVKPLVVSIKITFKMS